jgi:hypothetical protein
LTIPRARRRFRPFETIRQIVHFNSALSSAS